MLRFLFYSCFILAFAQGGQAQNTQKGGFIYEWPNYPSGEFGPLVIDFDSTTMRDIPHAPASGIHPRVYFGPGEIADIANRLNNTTSGQEVFAQLHAYTTLMHLAYSNGGSYSHSANYAMDAFGNRRISNAGKWDKHEIYYKLISNDNSALTGVDNKDRYLLCSVMALEAFECMIKAGAADPDTGLDYNIRADMLGTAMSNWAQLVIGDSDLNSDNYNYFGGVHMALAYDINYNAMTTNQRDSVRMALAEIIPVDPRYGVTTAPWSTTSNWTGLNTFELLTNMAIEGELGYNPNLTKDYMRAYRNFITYGWYASGTPYEGLGKNYQFVTSMIAAAKRGYSLLPHPYVKTYGAQFLPAITQPYGRAFIGTDVWGGFGWDNEVGGYKNNSADILGLKWIFPSNDTIDFVWRNFIEQSYDLSSQGYVYQQILPAHSGYHNYLLMAAIFAQDYTAGNWEAQNEIALGQNKSFFGEERGLSIMRSGFKEDDMLLHFHCRQDLGGHTNGDRNNISMSALGRSWIRYTYGSAFQETQYHSCLLIDDLGIAITPKDGAKARQPGKVLDFDDFGDHAVITGDATYAYSYEWHWEGRPPGVDHSWLGTNGWTKVLETWNDFKYQAGTENYHSIPFYDFDHWNQGGNLERMIKRPYNLMERVYRTALMVRAEDPYVLIVDDVQKDMEPHNYKWLAQIANDLVLVSTNTNLDYNNYVSDFILADPNNTKRLLIRVLNNNAQCNDSLVVSNSIPSGDYNSGGHIIGNGAITQNQNVNFNAGKAIDLENNFEIDKTSNFCAQLDPCTISSGIIEVLMPGINGNDPITRFVVEADDVITPDFKIMLFPHLDGDPLPTTKWNSDKSKLTVIGINDTQVIDFNHVNGRTFLTVN